MTVDDPILDKLKSLIKERLTAGIEADVRIESVDINADDEEIRIVVIIETSATSAEIGERFYGLTRHLREGLNDDLHDYFPIITPRVRALHA